MNRRELLALPLIAALPLAALAAEPAAKRDWFIFLETGKPTPPDAEAVKKMQAGHLENFVRLHAAGLLFAAGPMRDPAKVKRGIVVAKAATLAELTSYFQPDEYVREGYMTINASPMRPNKALITLAVNPGGIEEHRI
ncbi:MAG TPA: YciI family protein, partial [Burkholderiaceae bacterium]